jgi:hypothetical protein
MTSRATATSNASTPSATGWRHCAPTTATTTLTGYREDAADDRAADDAYYDDRHEDDRLDQDSDFHSGLGY